MECRKDAMNLIALANTYGYIRSDYYEVLKVKYYSGLYFILRREEKESETLANLEYLILDDQTVEEDQPSETQ